MGRRLELVPEGWPVPLRDCPPGPFVWVGEPAAGNLCWMSEYGDNNGRRDAYNISGEYVVWDRWKDAMVQPVLPRWVEEE